MKKRETISSYKDDHEILTFKLLDICQFLEEKKLDVQTRKAIEKITAQGQKKGRGRAAGRPAAKLTSLRVHLGLAKKL